MSTLIRPEVSKNNPYYISKHRYYELKHFCLQYREWKDTYISINNITNKDKTFDYIDPTCNLAIIKEECKRNMKLVEDTAMESDSALGKYILKAVTEDVAYTYLRTVLDMPCGKDMFYDRYRRFYWLLDRSR